MWPTDADAAGRLGLGNSGPRGLITLQRSDVAHDVGGFAHRRPTGQAERARGTGEPTDLKQDFGLTCHKQAMHRISTVFPNGSRSGSLFVHRMQMHHVTRASGSDWQVIPPQSRAASVCGISLRA